MRAPLRKVPHPPLFFCVNVIHDGTVRAKMKWRGTQATATMRQATMRQATERSDLSAGMGKSNSKNRSHGGCGTSTRGLKWEKGDSDPPAVRKSSCQITMKLRLNEKKKETRRKEKQRRKKNKRKEREKTDLQSLLLMLGSRSWRQ